METYLILRATGKGYQIHELDVEAKVFTATWPATEKWPELDTPRTIGRTLLRPSEIKGEVRKAYRAAFDAWDGRSFGYDKPAPAEPVRPPGARVLLRQASHVGGFKKPWVARITGASRTYRFARSFESAAETEHGGTWTFYLTDGFYEICNRNSKGGETRWFGQVEDGELVEVAREAVEAEFPELPEPAAPSPSTAEPEPEAVEDTPEGLALAMLRRVPAGVRKEDFLPFVRAALGHFDAQQADALDWDNTARSFAVAGEQIQYQRDFERLAGRPFATSDRITLAEVLALPVTPTQPPAPPREVIYECFECGATYPPEKAHLIDSGGMGCARCNH